MVVSIEDYCKIPQEYQDSLPAETVAYYNKICRVRISISKVWEKRMKNTGNDIWKGVKGIGKFIPNFLNEMITSIFTPEGLELLGIFEGVSLTSKVALNAILRSIAKGIGDSVLEEAAELAVEEGAPFVTSAILSTVISEAVVEGTAASIAFEVTTMTAEAISEVALVFSVVQLLGVIFDSWDPVGYGKMIDADIMETLVDKFNSGFEDKFLTSGNFLDSYGRKNFANVWPVEYYADNTIINDIDKTLREHYFLKYKVDYLKNLEYNSNGYKINWPKDGSKIVDNSFFNDFANQYSLMLSNSNTVVANWFKKYWIIVTVIIIGVIILLLVIK